MQRDSDTMRGLWGRTTRLATLADEEGGGFKRRLGRRDSGEVCWSETRRASAVFYRVGHNACFFSRSGASRGHQ